MSTVSSAMDPVEAVVYLLGCKEVVTSADATLVLVALSLDVQSAPAGQNQTQLKSRCKAT